MSDNLVISENCCDFKVLIFKSLQAVIAIAIEDKITEIFCIVDDIYKVFVAQMKNTLYKAI